MPLRCESPVASASVSIEESDCSSLSASRTTRFTKLGRASNNSPRGIWSDGDVMYVADASDGKVSSYNMPDAIGDRLALAEPQRRRHRRVLRRQHGVRGHRQRGCYRADGRALGGAAPGAGRRCRIAVPRSLLSLHSLIHPLLLRSGVPPSPLLLIERVVSGCRLRPGAGAPPTASPRVRGRRRPSPPPSPAGLAPLAERCPHSRRVGAAPDALDKQAPHVGATGLRDRPRRRRALLTASVPNRLQPDPRGSPPPRPRSGRASWDNP